MSADGPIVVGESLDAAGRERAFRWTAASGMQDWGTLGGARARALGLSPDTSPIVGSSQNASAAWRAFVDGTDCDADAVLDLCELRASQGLDCNANGVLDTCDLAAGTSFDVNQNGRLDECDCPGGAIPTVYCSAKLNSQLCLPAIDISAAPSASNTDHCTVNATNVLAARTGALVYG
ncbi:MAG: hypothetical protein FJ298_07425 [Planctomycetes bacterium]|nr:hypothetical protein [Planctomycetota bacterium]